MDYLKNIGSFLKTRFLGEEWTPNEEKEARDIFEGKKKYSDISNELFKKSYKENVIFYLGNRYLI